MDRMLSKVVSTMRCYSRPWWVAGGWAIDLHLGLQSRSHGDVDLAILRGDQRALRSTFRDWSLHKVVDGVLESWSTNEVLHLPVHEIHASRAAERLEFLLNESQDADWIFRRNPSIRMPIASASRRSPDGIPYLCPEIVLLYKAKSPRHHDMEDFNRAHATLDTDAKRWLIAALETCHAGHEWISPLRLGTNR